MLATYMVSFLTYVNVVHLCLFSVEFCVWVRLRVLCLWGSDGLELL